MIDLVGWIAGILFAVCAIPQTFKVYMDGNSDGLSSLMLWLWGGGEALMVTYVLFKHGFDGPLMLNYFGNLLCIIIMMKYKYFPRKEISK